MYRIAVIGRGLIGSAATRHLAGMTDGIVCVGPAEPKDRMAHTGVFASHYDEGRMTRVVDPFEAWSITARRSIERYAALENESGVRFFTPAGYLGIGTPDSDYNQRCAAAGSRNGATIRTLDAAGLRQAFPFLSVPDEADGLLETGTAGHISPRAMVEAQTVLAGNAGAEIVPGVVTAVRPNAAGVELETMDGQTLQAEKALIATGAFTAACGLVPADLGLTVFGRTVVRARIDQGLATALSGMPTLIHCASGAYILPPIRYPDGHEYVKIGIGTDADIRLNTLTELQDWFKGAGSEEDRRAFVAFLTDLIPPLRQCEWWDTDTCAVTQTASGLPIIDFAVDGKVAVAIGGNGKGAKGADEWGRIAACLLQGRTDDSPVEWSGLSLPRG